MRRRNCPTGLAALDARHLPAGVAAHVVLFADGCRLLHGRLYAPHEPLPAGAYVTMPVELVPAGLLPEVEYALP